MNNVEENSEDPSFETAPAVYWNGFMTLPRIQADKIIFIVDWSLVI